MKKIIKVMCLSILCVVSMPTLAAKYMLKYAHNDPVSDISKGHVPALFFKQYVESRTPNINVQIFPSGQMGGDQDSIQQVQAGALEVAQVSMGGVANFSPELQVLDLPYIMPNDAVAELLFEGELPKNVTQTLQMKLPNVRVVAMSNLARWRSFFTTKKEVKSLEDLKGLKIRTIQSKLQQEFVKSLGATPVSIPFGEVYTSLATGMADGLKNSPNDMIEFAWVENVKYGFLDQHSNLMGFFVISEKFLAQLSEEDRQIVVDGLQQTAKLQSQFNKIRETRSIEAFEKAGGKLYFLSENDKTQLASSKDHMITWYKEQYGDTWYNKYLDLIGKAQDRLNTQRGL